MATKRDDGRRKTEDGREKGEGRREGRRWRGNGEMEETDVWGIVSLIHPSPSPSLPSLSLHLNDYWQQIIGSLLILTQILKQTMCRLRLCLRIRLGLNSFRGASLH